LDDDCAADGVGVARDGSSDCFIFLAFLSAKVSSIVRLSFLFSTFTTEQVMMKFKLTNID